MSQHHGEAGWKKYPTESDVTGYHRHLPALARGKGRLIKTHERYRVDYKRAVLLVRDGRDVAVSEYFFQQAYSRHFFLYQNSFDVFLEKFLKGNVNGYGAWHLHIESWHDMAQRQDLLVVKFDDLKSSTLDTLRSIVSYIGIEASDDTLRNAIADCSVDARKRKEREFWGSKGEASRGFVRAAKSGGWRQQFTLGQEEIFWTVTGEVRPPSTRFSHWHGVTSRGCADRKCRATGVSLAG